MGNVLHRRERSASYRVIQQQNSKGYFAEPEKAIIDLLYFLKKTAEREYIFFLFYHVHLSKSSD